MNKVAGVVVTYNRKEKLKKNIECMKKQTYPLADLYIIDNCSTDGTYEYIKDIIENEKNIHYVRLDENTGGAGGFYTGIKEAYENGADYVWGMDDDAFPNYDALEQLMNVKEKIDEEVCLWSKCRDDIECNGEYVEVKWWMFVGFFIPRNIIKQVGFPRKDFFIYHDDSEYANRIIKNGFKIYFVKNSIIEHKDNPNKNMITKKIINKEITFPQMDNWRVYYMMRNSILMYSYLDKRKYKELLCNKPKDLIKIVLCNKKQIGIFFKAYVHGMFGVSGKRMVP